MKRLLSLMLAAAMILSMFAMTVSAADINYPVEFVWSTGFVKDEDGILQIGDGIGVDEVPYGSTVYYPLINTHFGDHNKIVALEDAKKARDEAKTALDAAKAPLQAAIDSAESVKNAAEEAKDIAETAKNAAETAKATAETAKNTAETKRDQAKNALDSITTNAPVIGGIFDDIIALVNSLPDDFANLKAGYDTKVNSITSEINNTWKKHLDDVNTYLSDTAEGYYKILDAYKETPSVTTDVDAIIAYVSNVKVALGTLGNDINEITRPEASDDAINNAKASFSTSLQKVKEQLNKKLGVENTLADPAPTSESENLYHWLTYYAQESQKIQNTINSINSKCTSLKDGYNIDISTDDRTNKTRLEELKAQNTSTSAAQTAYDNAVAELGTATTNLENAVSDFGTKSAAYDTALGAYNDAVSAYNTAVNNLANDTNVKAKQTAYDKAVQDVATAESAVGSNTNVFVFVTESAAVSNAKVKAEWDHGSKYVDKIELDKVKAVSSEFGMNNKVTSIYCIAVTLEDSKSTDEAEVEGEIAISKSGSNGYSLADTAASIYLTICAPVADPDSEITAEPRLFEADYSFDTEEDHIFYFDEDSTSWFEVNTKSQKDIVLAFDVEWDDDIADEIFEKNPNADLDFYNGNYAKFSKTGTLYLGYDEDEADDAYVYAISSSGKLSLVNAEYDEYEEAFAIRTNTLGRYVIATEKLKLSSTSSSTSGSGTGTVTASKSSTTTVASSSKPASSTPVSSSKPASSAPASSSQVSSQESSKESKPSSEPLSIKEPSSEEDNKYVSGTTDPKDEDVPTKKGGVSWIVWLLILAGLVAVVVAVGVIFYTKKNSGRRML